jgi:redox-sensitive bicupin YhaK (pirin superfamily)
MGNSTIIPPGDVQRMSAGHGVMHSEYNPEKTGRNHFFQIWITPLKTGISPSYEQKTFSDETKRGKLKLIASPDGRDNSLTINADASLYAGILDGGESISLALNPTRKAYVHLARGSLIANGLLLEEGDALLIAEEEVLTLSECKQVEVLVFDLSE